METLPPDYYNADEKPTHDPELDRVENPMMWLTATGLICLLAFGSVLIAIVSTP